MIPVDGSLAAVKLVHVSGTVTCSKERQDSYTFWGCGYVTSLDIINTLITSSSNVILLPENQGQGQGYRIPGYHSNSSQLIFPDFQTPLPVSLGQELRLWYSEDWADGYEADNGGLTCADIYAKYI